MSPDSGSIAGGTTLAITGTGLAGATGVRFGGAAAAITADSGTQITVTSPPGTGTVTITVTTPAGTSQTTAAGHYAYTTRPGAAQSISFTPPAVGTAGGSAALPATGGGSGNPVVFSVDPSSGPGVCTVSGATVTLHRRGQLRHRRQPGRHRRLRGRTPGPAHDHGQRGTGQRDAPGATRRRRRLPRPRRAGRRPNSGLTPAPRLTQTQPPALTPALTQPPAPAPAPTATATPSPVIGTPGDSTVTGWTAAEAPLPANAAGVAGAPDSMASTSVACPSASSCVTVGAYYDSSGNIQGVLATGSGTSWTAAQAPLPGERRR